MSNLCAGNTFISNVKEAIEEKLFQTLDPMTPTLFGSIPNSNQFMCWLQRFYIEAYNSFNQWFLRRLTAGSLGWTDTITGGGIKIAGGGKWQWTSGCAAVGNESPGWEQ